MSAGNLKQTLNNFQAATLLHNLCPDKSASIYARSSAQRKAIATEATSIYGRIEEKTKSIDVIHKICKIYLYSGHSRQIMDIWSDIETAPKPKLEFALIVKCCIDSGNVAQCLQALRWMESTRNYVLNTHNKLIAKLLYQCGNQLKNIQFIHRLIEKRMISNHDVFIKTALMNAYGRVNQCDTAKQIFASIEEHELDIVCISAMMKLHIKQQEYEAALALYDRIDAININHPALVKDDICHHLALQASSQLSPNSNGDAARAVPTSSHNIKTQTSVMYSHKNNPDKAWQIFHSFEDGDKDAIFISTMMKILNHNNCHSQTLELYDAYFEKICKNHVCNLMAIKACTKLKDYDKGKAMHAQCSRLKHNLNFQNALISFYSTCEDFNSALAVYEGIAVDDRDIYTYTSVMQAYLGQNDTENVVRLYRHVLDHTQLRVDAPCHSMAMKAYTKLGQADKANAIFVHIQKNAHDVDSKLALMAYYGLNDDVCNALQTYESIPLRHLNAACTNAILTVYLDQRCYKRVIELYASTDACQKDSISHSIALKACQKNSDLAAGKNIHVFLKQKHSSSSSSSMLTVQLKTQLIDFYGSCKDVESAVVVFRSIDEDAMDVVCVGAMMKCLVNNECNEDAVDLYRMYETKYASNIALHCLAIKACTNLERFCSVQKIIDLHSDKYDKCTEWLSAMIYFSGHSKQMKKAWTAFDSIYEYQRDIVMVNHMLMALNSNACYEQCHDLFQRLLSEQEMDHLAPNVVSFTNALIMSANTNMLQFGKQIHDTLKSEKYRWMMHDIGLLIHLIAMYSKCGNLEMCTEVFESQPELQQHIGIWNSMIEAYADHAQYSSAQALYRRVKMNNLQPDKNTFALMIKVYGGQNDIQQAIHIWEKQINNDELRYDQCVVSCLVDALSKHGLLDKAQQIISKQQRRHSMR